MRLISKLGNAICQKENNVQFVAFNETISNVFRNYVPNKYINVDDKDPIWMNETIKSKN